MIMLKNGVIPNVEYLGAIGPDSAQYKKFKTNFFVTKISGDFYL